MNKHRKVDTIAIELIEEFCELAHQILMYANQGMAMSAFLQETLAILSSFFENDLTELWIKEAEQWYRCSLDSDTQVFSFESSAVSPQLNDEKPQTTVNYPSLALTKLGPPENPIGVLQFKSHQQNFFSRVHRRYYDSIGKIVCDALHYRRTQAALHERIKEIGCLYAIAKVVEEYGSSLNKVLQNVVELLPPGWQYPEITSARITLDDNAFLTDGFCDSNHRLFANIVVNGEVRGAIEVFYVEKKHNNKILYEKNIFLKEEQNLIDAIAKQLALSIERIEAAEYNSRLQEQLRHADRLATIGQLASGVAHELNEPLGNIMGFAQLAIDCPKLPQQAQKDINKILKSSLYAREIIKKLMVFARQMPPQNAQVNLNRLVEEGLYFLEARCSKQGIEICCELFPPLPEIAADPAQLHQVLVNLVVNSIQAMPNGGKITIRTDASPKTVLLVVTDTGSGIRADILKKIFIPFFTTKDIDEGTGLGLAVVHGIVTAHKGTIEVVSKENQGTQFTVQLPINAKGKGNASG